MEEGGPTGDLAFAVVGDAPYYPWETGRFERIIEAIDGDSLDMLVHVGDLFWRPCSGDKMRERLSALLSQRHPVVYTPGDNEWTDCWGDSEGGYQPLERLDTLRSIYFADPGRTLGVSPFPVEHQGARPEWYEFVENVRWSRAGLVFATVHVVGSWNALSEFPGRSVADDEASARRTAAAEAWTRETFRAATESRARAVVFLTHAFPDPATYSEAHRAAFEPWLRSLEEEVAAFPGPVVLIHGDDHEYVVDRPLADRRTGRLLTNFTRMQVMGSPDVGWVRVVVSSEDGVPVFDFSPRRTPGWRVW